MKTLDAERAALDRLRKGQEDTTTDAELEAKMASNLREHTSFAPHTALTLEYALRYAKRGWRVIWSHWPIGRGDTAKCSCSATDIRDGKEQHAVGKHPGRDWVNQATTDERVIRAWFTVKPNANVSIVTGVESGIFVLDIDPRSGGLESIEELTTKHGMLPKTPTFFTGSGGYHLLFKNPEGINIPTKANIGPGIDIRGQGGQIIAPPSRNVNGYYEIDPDSGLDLEVAEAPGWLRALISAPNLDFEDDAHRKTRFDIQAAIQGAPAGRRDDTIFRLAATLRDRGIPEEVALVCVRQAAENCRPPFPIGLAEDKVRNAYKKYEPRVDWNREVLQRKETPRQVGREWVRPYPLGAPTGLPLPENVFPAWLDRYIQIVAQEIQVPASMVAMIALSTISACIAKKGVVRITPSWKETLNIYTVVACPPSSRKSPTFTAVTEPIFECQRNLIAEFEASKSIAQFERDGLKMRLDRLKKEFAKSEALTAPPSVAALQAKVNDLELVDLPRLLADDVTPEKLCGLLFRNQERIAVFSSDGNDIFKQMGAKYKSVADPTLYIKGWSGDTKIVDRMGRTEYLREPIITMSLAVQPKVMRGVIRSEAADQGLLARIMYCYPEDNVGKRKIDFDPYNYDPSTLDFQTRDVYRKRLAMLLALPIPEPTLDLDGKRHSNPNVVVFDDDALKGFLDFENSLELERGRVFDDDKREWLGKLGGNVARVIAILHLVENIEYVHPDPEYPDSMKYLEDVWRFPVMPKTVEAGVKLGEWFISHAVAAFEEMQSDPIKNLAIVLVKWIREQQLSTFHKNETIQHLSTAGDKAHAALTFLCERGYIRTHDPNARLDSHDNLQFEVNPAVLTGDFRSIDDEDA